MDVADQPSKLVPLPGADRLQYGIEGSGSNLEISVWDPEVAPRAGRTRAVGILRTEQLAQDGPPFPDAAEVSYIAVDPRYRGQGVAQGMYQVVLQVLKRTLVAGTDQTPGGQRNWVSLWRTPGVEVRGWLKLEDHPLDLTDKVIDHLMGRLGADYIGQSTSSRPYRFFAFEVQSMASGRRMESAVKSSMAKIYGRLSDDNPVNEVGMYAVWGGK